MNRFYIAGCIYSYSTECIPTGINKYVSYARPSGSEKYLNVHPVLVSVHFLVSWYQVPASCGKIAEMTNRTSRIHTPVDPILKYIIWLSRKTVIIHSWHDRFEFYYARIWFGRNYFRVKLISQSKTPQSKKLGFFYRRARFRRGQMRAHERDQRTW
jgi:hypothetical protein